MVIVFSQQPEHECSWIVWLEPLGFKRISFKSDIYKKKKKRVRSMKEKKQARTTIGKLVAPENTVSQCLFKVSYLLQIVLSREKSPGLSCEARLL